MTDQIKLLEVVVLAKRDLEDRAVRQRDVLRKEFRGALLATLVTSKALDVISIIECSDELACYLLVTDLTDFTLPRRTRLMGSMLELQLQQLLSTQ